jgi:hypothetical protein
MMALSITYATTFHTFESILGPRGCECILSVDVGLLAVVVVVLLMLETGR